MPQVTVCVLAVSRYLSSCKKQASDSKTHNDTTTFSFIQIIQKHN